MNKRKIAIKLSTLPGYPNGIDSFKRICHGYSFEECL